VARRSSGGPRPSAYTEPTVSLKEFGEEQIKGEAGVLASDLRSLKDIADERWGNHKREHAVADTARIREAGLQAEALRIADVARAEALRIASDSLETYKKTSNEFRGTLEDQASHFLTKAEHQSSLDRLSALENDRIARDAAAVANAKTEAEAKERERSERQRQQWTFGAAVTVVSIVIGILLRFIGQ
jgi:hypothetical protein